MIAECFIGRKRRLGATACCPRVSHALMLAAACVVVMGGDTAFGQACTNAPFTTTCNPNLRHGNGGRAEASDTCVGETLNATGEIFFGDNFADAWRVTGALLRVNFVLVGGTQPIVEIIGNAVCSGAGCDPHTGANCVFPCLIGPAFPFLCSEGALSLPGLPQAGSVVVKANYVVQPSDVGPVGLQFEFSNLDLGTFDCTNTPLAAQTVVAPGNIGVPGCGDSDPCNIDCCALGVCSHPSTCDGATCRDVNGNVTVFPPLVCNDNDVCTGPDTCDATLPNSTPQQCCSYPEIPCPERECFRFDECDPVDRCLYTSLCTVTPNLCDDSDVCTRDTCNDGVPGCCQYANIPCPTPPACFTQGPCDREFGCPPPVSDCVTNPNLCDDGNVCTRDICDESAPGCCRHEDIPCPTPPVCFTQGPCDSETACPPPVSDCVTNPTLCDDHNVCTRDICDVLAPGCCRHEDIPCPTPPVCFTQGPCDSETACPPPVSDCVTNPTLCDDHNLCTRDICDVLAPGCCRHEDIPCPTPDVCHIQGACIPASGCPAQTSVCPGRNCDDGDPCTTDTCDDTATGTGCCVHAGTCPCSVTIAKTVAPDTDCNGIADSAFVENVTVDKIECVIYKVCVTNSGPTGAQDLNASDVTLNDAHLGIVNVLHLDFGTLTPGQTACKEIPSVAVPAANCPDEKCICQDVEGTNTASVSNVICVVTVDSACDTTLHPGSDCSDNAKVDCTGGCRITAGRTNRLDKLTEGAQGPRGQGGGQVGAPCGCTGCFTTGDPEADLAFEHIQGNWQYDRKYPGADQFKQGTFHAKQFNSLICGCCSADLPNCTEGGTNQNPGAGACFKQGAVSDPLNGKVCGDRITGPLPRPAGANIICFSGIGDWVDTNGRKIDKVAFRVEAEDRGEPSVGKNADETCDYHRIRIWVPTTSEIAKVLADAVCCTNALDANLNVPGVRLPNIDDGGNLVHGNIQIHPATPNSNRGRCPIPDGTCQQP